MNQLSVTIPEYLTLKRLLAVALSAAVVMAVFLLSRLIFEPQMALLYSGVEPSSAGEVLEELERSDSNYEIRGSSIFVASDERDQLRFMLASKGLPKYAPDGYEILDQVSGFGTTSQMFDAAYWRAKEGELSRTITSLPIFRNARVHISFGAAGSLNSTANPSASVSVEGYGQEVSLENARALRYLVASAVPSLLPSSVSIIDSGTGRLVSTEGEDGYNLTSDRSEEIRTNIQELLEAHLGRGRVKVEVNLEAISELESIVERRIDPASRVAISTDTREISDSSTSSGPPPVTVASNVPSGPTNGSGSGQSTNNQGSEISERSNFEVSETNREIRRPPGDIKRLSIAVLVDGREIVDQSGNKTWQPRSEVELQDIQELAQAASGFKAERGDIITVKSLQFEPLENGVVAEPILNGFTFGLSTGSALRLAVVSIVSLLLGLLVLRPALLSRPEFTIVSTNETTQPASSIQLANTADQSSALDGRLTEEVSTDLGSLGEFNSEFPLENGFNFLPSEAPGDIAAVQRLKEATGERGEDVVELLRGWLSETGRDN